MKRWYVRLSIIVVLLTGCDHAEEANLYVVRKADVTSGFDIEGALASENSQSIKPPVAGNSWQYTITALAPDGEEVKAGDVLVSFDDSEMVKELEQQKNELDSAKADFEKRRNDLTLSLANLAMTVKESEAAVRKAEMLMAQSADVVGFKQAKQAKLDAEKAVLERDGAKEKYAAQKHEGEADLAILGSRVKMLEGSVELAEAAVKQLTIVAPEPGLVVHVNDDEEKIRVGSRVHRMGTVLELVMSENMMGRGTVDEADVAKLTVKMPVTFRVDSNPDVEISAEIKTIESSVAQEEDSPLKKVRVELSVKPTAAVRMRPGMRFRGTVMMERRQGVLVVPFAAVFLDEKGPYVVRQDGRKRSMVRVKIGVRNQEVFEVTEGLREGDQIVLGSGAES